MESRLKFFSYGYVTEAKSLNSNECNIYPSEIIPNELGSISSQRNTATVKGVDADGNEYQISGTSVNFITATWMDLGGGNRVTAPDVRIGEEVMLMRYSDNDQYFWVPTGQNKSLRRLETIKYRVSATTDESVTELTDDNSIVIEISSHLNRIQLFTSKKNGEFCRYAAMLDMEKGYFTLVDDVNNRFLFDSKNTVIEAENADGSVFSLNKTLARLFTADKIDIETNELVVKTQTSTLDAGQSTVIKSGSATTMESPNTLVNSKTTISGDVATKGKLTNNDVDVGETHQHDETQPAGKGLLSGLPKK